MPPYVFTWLSPVSQAKLATHTLHLVNMLFLSSEQLQLWDNLKGRCKDSSDCLKKLSLIQTNWNIHRCSTLDGVSCQTQTSSKNLSSTDWIIIFIWLLVSQVYGLLGSNLLARWILYQESGFMASGQRNYFYQLTAKAPYYSWGQLVF